MRSYDRIDIELVHRAPRGWGDMELQSLHRAFVDIFRAQRKGMMVRSGTQTGLHIAVRQAHAAYIENGQESPWVPEADPVTGGVFFTRTGRWAEATGVGIIFPIAEPPPVTTEPEPEDRPLLKAKCPRCGFEPNEEPEAPTFDVHERIDRTMMLSMRKDARLIVGAVIEAGGVSPSKEIKDKLRQHHDVQNDRTDAVLQHLVKAGILERPERAVFRIVKVAP